MSDPSNHEKLNRRALLLGAVLLVGGAAALTRFTRKPRCRRRRVGAVLQRRTVRAARAGQRSDDSHHRHAGRHRRRRARLHARRCSTSGARPRSRAEIVGVLEAIEKQAWSKFGAAFLELAAGSPPRGDAAHSTSERLARAGPGVRASSSTWCWSATTTPKSARRSELRYELVPGAWRSCLPLSEIGRASAV